MPTLDSDHALESGRVDPDQFAEVMEWLKGKFGEDQVPSFEVNAETVGILHKLCTENRVRDRECELITADLRMKADEYGSEAKRLGKTLACMGVDVPESLSYEGQNSLNTLTSIANTLKIKDVSLSSYFGALSSLTIEANEVTRQLQHETSFNEEAAARVRDGLVTLNELKSMKSQFEKDWETQRVDMESKTGEIEYMKKKCSQYAVELSNNKEELRRVGVSSSIQHSNLCSLSEEVVGTREELTPLKQILESYEGLPPDLHLAKLRVESSRTQLAMLEDKLTRAINAIHAD